MSGWSYVADRVSEDLKKLRDADRLRTLLPAIKLSRHVGSWLDLTHNDYLGLREDPEFRLRGFAVAKDLEFGSGASRLLGGNHQVFGDLEVKFSHYKGCANSLYFSSGFLANIGLLTTLAKFGGRFFSDELNHASIIDGLRLAGIPREDREIFRHLDGDDLERRLQRSESPVNYIVTESVFSMDGDVADLRHLQQLAQQYRGVIIVDEAHAVGCFGRGGNGMVSEQGLDHGQVISVNAGGKALGVQGALVSGPDWLRDALINHARSFIYSTAPSPFIAGVADAAIGYVTTLGDRRRILQERSSELRLALQAKGMDTGSSHTHILPIILGSDNSALAMSARLYDRGILARAIRPPTVPQGQSRVRISLNSGISVADIHRIVEASSGGRP
jgi:8-amino-7-oxononanoate synthase